MITIKKYLKIYRMLPVVLIIILLSPMSIHASAKSDITPLLNAMHKFVYYNMYNTVGTESELGKNYTIKRNDQNMLTASVLSTKFYNNEILEKTDADPWYVIYKLSSSKLEKRCKDLFGKTASVSALQGRKDRYKIWTLFQQSGSPCLYAGGTETDSDLIRTSLSIKKTGGGTYTVKESMYFGHWLFDNKTAIPNYIVTYKLKKNSASSFRFVIKNMKIKRIGDVPGLSIPIF